MKRLMVAIASGSSAAVLFAATPVDRVLTIDLAEDTLLSALTDEVSCLQNNEATNVVLQGGKKLTLDVNLDQYAGGWDIKNGVANLTKGKNGFGVYGDGAPVVVSSSSGQICMNGNVEIDKPVHFAGVVGVCRNAQPRKMVLQQCFQTQGDGCRGLEIFGWRIVYDGWRL